MEAAVAVGWFLMRCGGDTATADIHTGVQGVNRLAGVSQGRSDGDGEDLALDGPRCASSSTPWTKGRDLISSNILQTITCSGALWTDRDAGVQERTHTHLTPIPGDRQPRSSWTLLC